MKALQRLVLLSVSALALLSGILLPLGVSAANSNDGKLKVYVEVDNHYNNDDYDPSDFTVRVEGRDVSKDSFRGSDNGTTVYVDGWYSVSVNKKGGYTPSYSRGCNGDLDHNDTETCRITMEGSYNHYDYNYDYGYSHNQDYFNYYYQGQQYYYPQQYQQATVVSKYVPGLPNTGFEPISSAVLSFVLALFAVAALLALPYVRKTLAAVIR